MSSMCYMSVTGAVHTYTQLFIYIIIMYVHKCMHKTYFLSHNAMLTLNGLNSRLRMDRRRLECAHVRYAILRVVQ